MASARRKALDRPSATCSRATPSDLKCSRSTGVRVLSAGSGGTPYLRTHKPSHPHTRASHLLTSSAYETT